MKRLKKLLSFLLSILIITGNLYLPVFSADGAVSQTAEEATLTVKEFTISQTGEREFGEATVTSGAFDTLLNEVVSQIADVSKADKFYDYNIMLNKSNVTFSSKTFASLNENTYVTIDFNGNTANYSGNTSIFVSKGGVKLTIDGADDNGTFGTVVHSGTKGAFLEVTKTASTGSDDDNSAVTNIYGLDINVTNMSSASTTAHIVKVGYGDAEFKNMSVKYSGINTSAEINMLHYDAGKNLLIDNCIILDVSKAKTTCIYVGVGETKALIKDTVAEGYYALNVNDMNITLPVVNSILSGVEAINYKNGVVKYYDCTLTTESGVIAVSGTTKAYLYSTGAYGENGKSVVYSKVNFGGVQKCKTDPYFAVKQVENSDKEGYYKYEAVSAGGVEAIGFAIKPDNTVYYQNDKLNSLLTNDTTGIETLSGVVGTDATVTIGVFENLVASSSSSAYVSAPLNFKTLIKLNGHNVTFSGTNTRFINLAAFADFTIDGAGDNNSKSEVVNSTTTSNGEFVMFGSGSNASTSSNLELKNIKFTYSSIPSIISINKGNAMALSNIEATYKGTKNGTMFDFYSCRETRIDNCVIEDKSTEAVTAVRVINKAYINNSDISANNTVNLNGTVTADIRNSTLYGRSLCFAGAASSTSRVIGCTLKTDGNIADTALAVEKVVLVYANGENKIISPNTPNANLAQPGYVFEKTDETNNIWTMKADGSCNGTTAVIPEDGKAIFTKTIDTPSAVQSVNTEYYINANKNNATDFTGKTISGDEHTTVYINFDGYDISASSNCFTISGTPKVYISGAGKDGKKSTVTASSKLKFISCQSGNPKAEISKLNLVFNGDPGQMLDMRAGSFVYDTVNISYVGESSTASAEGDIMFFKGSAQVSLKNCKITDDNEKSYTSIHPLCFGSGDKSKVNIENSEISSTNIAIYFGGEPHVEIKGGKVTSGRTCYHKAKNATVIVEDTVHNIGNGEFVVGTGTVTLKYGTGNTKIVTDSEKIINSGFVIEDGYGLFSNDSKEWIVSEGNGFRTIKLPAIFADGMVLQRGKDINVFGTCMTESGETVEIRLTDANKEVHSAYAEVENYSWRATIKGGLPAQKNCKLEVYQTSASGSQPIVYNNIDIGEIWVNSGQSNADYELYKMEDVEEYSQDADNYDIKTFVVSKDTSVVADKEGKGTWYPVTKDTIDNKKSIPAISYVMARRIADEVGSDVTVAIVHAAYVGSSIASWISEEFYPNSDLMYNDKVILEAYKKFYAENKRMPNDTEKKDFGSISYEATRPHIFLAGSHYNTMIASLEGYSVKGVVWYQGCCDNGSATRDKYPAYFDALKKTYRKAFADSELPIAVIQLAPQTAGGTDFEANQYSMTTTDKNTFLVSSFTEGSVFEQSDYDCNPGGNVFIHPSRKSPIGHRLADTVLEKIYNIGKCKSSPEILKIEADANKLIVTFNQNIYTELGLDVEGFEIAGDSGYFHKATGTVNGNTLTLTSSIVAEPKAVRYGYGNTIIEFRDGARIPYNVSLCSIKDDIVTLVDGTNTYKLRRENGEDYVARTKYNGNLYGQSGHPVPVFKLSVGHSVEGGLLIPSAKTDGETKSGTGLKYLLKKDGTYEVTGYEGNDVFVTIPSEYNGKAVTSVKSNAFAFGKNITSITVPDSVVSIGYGAFSGAVSLKEIILPFVGGSAGSSNEFLGFIFGASTFKTNSANVPASLEKVTLSANCVSVPEFAFYGCLNLKNIELGGVSKLGMSAFYGCAGLGRMFIPSSIDVVYANNAWYNSPFVSCDDITLITENTASPNTYGAYWSNISQTDMSGVSIGTAKAEYDNPVMDKAELSEIYVNGTAIGAVSGKYDYEISENINNGYSSVLTFKMSSAGSKIKYTPASIANNGVATVKITSGDGSKYKTYTIKYKLEGTFTSKSEVVNKDGKDAVVTFVVDDYKPDTAEFVAKMLKNYKHLKFSMAVPIANFAELKTKTDGDKVIYEKDADGKYVYTLKENNIANYKAVLDAGPGRAEIINHTYQHYFWGNNDEGGKNQQYVNTSGVVKTDSKNHPVGSASAQIYASEQIIEEVFGKYQMPQSKLSFVNPGIGVVMSDVTVDGITYPSYYTDLRERLINAVEEGTLIGSRGTRNELNFVSNLKTPEGRIDKVSSFMVEDTEKVSKWTNFIDNAISQDAWACFCIHQMRTEYIDDHHILQSDAEELFNYSMSKNVWITTFTEALLYYNEWSTSTVSADYSGKNIKVTLTDEENDKIYNQSLTVKVTVPPTSISACVGSEMLEIHRDGMESFVYVNIVPDRGPVTISLT